HTSRPWLPPPDCVLQIQKNRLSAGFFVSGIWVCLRLGPFAPRAVLLHRYIREDRAYCRSTRPGCECQPAAAELPITPFAPRAVLLHRYIREDRAYCRSTRPGCECQPAAAELPITPFAPRRCSYTDTSEKAGPAVGAPAPGAKGFKTSAYTSTRLSRCTSSGSST